MSEGKIIGHLGSANEPEKKGEKSKFEKFLHWMVPWLKDKAIKADKALDAELEIKAAQAAKIRAEANKVHAETIKLTIEAEKTKLEVIEKSRKLEEMNTIEISEEKEKILRRLEENIQKLQIIKGGRILEVSEIVKMLEEQESEEGE